MVICILGRQPAIGLAELESLYGADAVQPIDTTHALVDAEVDFARLGSTIKTAELIDTIDGTNPQKAFDHSRRALPDFISDFPEGKIKLGASLYGLQMPLQKQNANTLSLKKVLRQASGRSVRVVPNTEAALSSAQTYHNQLASELGCELLFVRHGNQTLIGRLTHVQNINEYAERDRERPKRDARVGMLPPKLAQTIINLGVGTWKAEDGKSTNLTVLDPFCGTGVVLQEASLMGYSVYGTDIEPRMIDYSRTNLEWLAARTPHPLATPKLEVGDATSHTWHFPASGPQSPTSVSIACEGYLGIPFTSVPAEAALKDTIMTCNLITKKFLRNIHGQIEAGTRLCIAVPAWHVHGKTHHLPFIDSLNELGYTRVSFTHASDADLLYHREDQIVGRELIVLEK